MSFSGFYQLKQLISIFMDLPRAPERLGRWAMTRGIPGLKRETWDPLRVLCLLGLTYLTNSFRLSR
jgi:hypothetical protein